MITDFVSEPRTTLDLIIAVGGVAFWSIAAILLALGALTLCDRAVRVLRRR